MANEENLVPRTSLSKEEAKKMGRKGGKASVEARRKKKLMKEQAELLLSLPLKDAKVKKKVSELGIDADNADNQMALIIAMWQKALKGDTSAATWLRDLIGEKPVDKVEVSASVDKTAKEIDEYVESRSK